MKHTLIIPEAFNGLTIKTLLEDKFLIPRKVRHFLRIKKHVQLNGQPINWQTTVTAGDKLDLTFDKDDYPAKTIPQGNASLVKPLYEDEHLVIVNKPEGMKTHANQPNEIALLNHVSTYVGKTCYVVHRLDKETSGAMLFAKNPFVLPVLNRLLEDKRIFRTYLALCQGQVKEKKLTLTAKIGRDRHDRRKRIVDMKSGQTAYTQVARLKNYPTTSLIKCQLKTGRTHQIRVHLAHQNHALIGDPLYSTICAPRLMLHAQSLELIHPFTLEKISVIARSESFEQVLTSYKK